ncbi:MAG: GIY-YIG nuclease family protein [Flavobacteriales bacterium]|nr:GIY-YIG nuclease family protein [Flavobacteriales bacterium]
MEHGGYLYILTNRPNGVLYLGVTSSLYVRVAEHKANLDPIGYSTRYNLHKLVYFEGFANIEEAIAKEKKLKAGSRKNKIALIEAMNPTWRDLHDGNNRPLTRSRGSALPAEPEGTRSDL